MSVARAPLITELSSTGLVTMALIPRMASRPMATLFITLAPGAIHVFSPTFTLPLGLDVAMIEQLSAICTL
jgi:hypothetical protein